jgi:hypothetical protein
MGLNVSDLPQGRQNRSSVLSESIEGVFVLGRGCVVFDNASISLMNDAFIVQHPGAKYMTHTGADGNLLWLFLLLTQAGSNTVGQWANLVPYLQRSQWQATFD